jgi:hypothetical protein
MLGVDFNSERKRSEQHILEFWQRAEVVWPVLTAVARDYLAIPASGIGVERLFNTARDVITYRRHRLQPDTVSKIMLAVCANRFDALQLKYSKEDHSEYEMQLVEVITDSESDIEEYEEDEVFEGMISDNEELDGTENTVQQGIHRVSRSNSASPTNRAAKRIRQEHEPVLPPLPQNITPRLVSRSTRRATLLKRL